jgi:hypothetical protein
MEINKFNLQDKDYNDLIRNNFVISESFDRCSAGRLAALGYGSIALVYGIIAGGLSLAFGSPFAAVAIAVIPTIAIEILSHDLYKSCCNTEAFFKDRQVGTIYTESDAEKIFEKVISGTILRSIYSDYVSLNTQRFKTLCYLWNNP